MLIISKQKHFNGKLKMESISIANNSTVTAHLAVLSSGKHLAWLFHVFRNAGLQAFSSFSVDNVLIHTADLRLQTHSVRGTTTSL